MSEVGRENRGCEFDQNRRLPNVRRRSQF
jgi:hypothetical protein